MLSCPSLLYIDEWRQRGPCQELVLSPGLYPAAQLQPAPFNPHTPGAHTALWDAQAVHTAIYHISLK